MPALITGAQGQLGRDLARLIPDATALGREQLPIDDEVLVRRHLAEVRPEVVYNCAAYNAVDAAEQDPEPAIAVNAAGPENLARGCLEIGARLVHFSTNYVFDGDAAEPYDEDDRPNPRSRYGRSKLEGEERVLALMPSALVIRSSGLFGLQGSAIKGGSFPERILARARAGQPLKVVADQRLNPTFTRDLAAGSHRLAESGMTGVVHLVAGGECSYWELAVEALRLSGLTPEVGRAASADFATAAPRPLNGCLRSHRTEPLRDWREGLAEYMEALVRTPS
ncbi:MAG TPA: dTDP-4-dehydrorhamnose reductase [Candidatus Dormibacteraeota bacterium]|jgi:dTDP-4-dehydrorhamnose reductase|nr:dTDP-4-dehydrorhamnose reductase [Candidatus Dormibacteraeota bacterium]